jgi:RNA polymerase sigma-70 factor (ECF subfamily)
MALRQEDLGIRADEVDIERDRALVERCQAGDATAFEDLYARYYDRLLRFCLRKLHDRDESEDAAQEAFARAWRALPQFAGERRFYPWLTVIAGNICTDILRRRARTQPAAGADVAAQQLSDTATTESSEDLVLAAVDGELVARALDRLTPRHRKVLALREGSGLTYQEIAQHEGVEVGTIETLIWRARQSLKREFAIVSESRAALGGVLLAGVLASRRLAFSVARRLHALAGGGHGGAIKAAVAGVALTSAAVTAVATTLPVSTQPTAAHTRPAATVPTLQGTAGAGRTTHLNPSPPSAVPSSAAGDTGAPATSPPLGGGRAPVSPSSHPTGTSGGPVGTRPTGGLPGATVPRAPVGTGSLPGGGVTTPTVPTVPQVPVTTPTLPQVPVTLPTLPGPVGTLTTPVLGGLPRVG